VSIDSRSFREALLRYTSPDVLVVDEVGYLTYAHDAANVLFHVVNDRHLKKRSMIFTTNKPFSSWGAVLHDDDLAQVILDRVFERGRHIKLDGPSIRTLYLDGALPTEENERARVSGTPGPEFSEPTPEVNERSRADTYSCVASRRAVCTSADTSETPSCCA
jgi:hypothetical protein